MMSKEPPLAPPKRVGKDGEATPKRVGMELPTELDSEAFRDAWALWVQHRKEIRKKLTPTSTQMQLKKLAAWGERRAIAAIYNSIENGWQGLFEPKAVATPVPITKVRGQEEAKPDVVNISPEMMRANRKRLSEMFRSKGML